MKTIQLILLFVIGIFIFRNQLIGQNEPVEIRLLNKSIEEEDMFPCLDVQIKTTASVFSLAAQNYRLYYDASNFRFDRIRSQSILPDNVYSPLTIKQDIFNSNATGFGSLEFDAHLGFVNMTISDSGNLDELVSLSTDEWVSTAQVCFENIENSNPALTLIWAREGFTEGYATAFTEIAQIKNGKLIQSQLIFHDFQSDKPTDQSMPKVATVKN
jgi:hypothetical protein